MSGDMWAVFLVACAGFGVWEVIKARRAKPTTPGAPADPTPADQEGFAGARKGRPPHPHANIIEMPGGAMRIIDLRGMPVEDLRIARLGLVHEQLLLERPVPVQIWVAPVEIVRGWTQLSEVALAVMNGRFSDARLTDGQNYIYPFGGTLTEAEGRRLQIAGVDVVLDFTNLSDPPRRIEDFLDPVEVWTESPDDRPIPPHDVLSVDPFDGKPIRIIEGFAFIDLRRLYPDGWTSGVALDRVEKLFRTLVSDKTVTHVVWVVAPWVLERIEERAVTRIERLVDVLPVRMQQRLAVLAAAGEPVGAYTFTERLGRKLRPLEERFAWRTVDRGAFEVHPIEALHDAYFFHAWKQPRL
jgi:hypothetical protein